jgi:hypothetical protein
VSVLQPCTTSSSEVSIGKVHISMGGSQKHRLTTGPYGISNINRAESLLTPGSSWHLHTWCIRCESRHGGLYV